MFSLYLFRYLVEGEEEGLHVQSVRQTRFVFSVIINARSSQMRSYDHVYYAQCATLSEFRLTSRIPEHAQTLSPRSGRDSPPHGRWLNR